MPFLPPDFNLLCKIWNLPNRPVDGPANHVDVPVQKYIPSRGLLDIEYGEPELWVPPVYLRFPNNRVSEWTAMGAAEVPSGSGRYYLARWKERMHEGFSNAYLVAIADQCTAAGVPKARDVNYVLLPPEDPDPPPPPPSGNGSTCAQAKTISTFGTTSIGPVAIGVPFWIQWNRPATPSGSTMTISTNDGMCGYSRWLDCFQANPINSGSGSWIVSSESRLFKLIPMMTSVTQVTFTLNP